MKNKGKSVSLLRGMTNVSAVLFAIAIGATSIAEANAGTINSALGTTNTKIENGDGNTDTEYYTSDYSSLRDLVAAREELNQEMAAESTVLLKNLGRTLPLAAGARVTLFGMGSHTPLYGASASGGSQNTSKEDQIHSLEACLTESGIEINPEMVAYYASQENTRLGPSLSAGWGQPSADAVSTGEVAIPASLESSYDAYSDAAICVITRGSSEGADWLDSVPNDCLDGPLSLSQAERDMLEAAKRCSDNVIVLLNCVNPMEVNDLNEDPDISAIVWVGFPGTSGFYGVVDVLLGNESPSGRLVDTWAVDSHSAPAMQNFGDYTYTNADEISENRNAASYVVYQEGIYVGYRYYETRYEDSVLGQGNADSDKGSLEGAWNYDDEVTYGFGYGLSYTSFEQEIVDFVTDDDTVSMTVHVTNTGDVPGKDVVQMYVQTPYTDYDREHLVEKSAVQLVGFEKTDELAPGESQELIVVCDKRDYASYDYTYAKTYIMDAGAYYFSIGEAHEALNNILAAKGYAEQTNGDADLVRSYTQDTLDNTTYAVSETGVAVTNQLEDADINYYQDGAVTYLSRSDWAGTWSDGVVDLAATDEMLQALNYMYTPATDDDTSAITFGADTNYPLSMMIGADYDDPDWDKILDQLTLEDAVFFICNAGSGIPAANSIVSPFRYGAEGPTGLKDRTYWRCWDVATDQDRATFTSESDPYANYDSNTYQVAVNTASTWNKTLMEEMGRIFGEDSLRSNVPYLLAPALNIHRTPYSGRNLEYYSEDPVLSAYATEAFSKGATEKGVLLTAKHYAFNDQETNRNGLCTFLNEQGAREIQLRAFERACASGALNGIMTAYNRVGCEAVASDEGVCTGILRNEWGFKGFVVTDFIFLGSWYDPLLIATTGTSTILSTGDWFTVDRVKGDANLLSGIRETMHYALYAFVNSNGMNGIASDARLVHVYTWWEMALIAVEVVLGVLTLGLAFMYVSTARKQSAAAQPVQHKEVQ